MAFIVHLDDSFVPRMPDRSQLYNADGANARISKELTACVQRYLNRRKAEMEPEAFVTRYWEAARGFHVRG